MKQDDLDPLREANRRSWNAATPAHQSHKRDQGAFLKGGGTTLFPEELELLGDLSGKRVLHLQCNCGQDSISLALRGAEVLGVDLSDAAIDEARALETEVGSGTSFECAEVLGWMETARERGLSFDFVFASYGALPWIEDLAAWCRGAASLLRPGGALVVLEFHPIVWSFGEGDALVDSYFLDGPIEERSGVSDYVARSQGGLSPSGHTTGVEDFENTEVAYAFQWTIADLLNGVADAGLRTTRAREWPHANGCLVMPGLVRDPDADVGVRWIRPEGAHLLPLMFGLRAER